ncbi:MAG: tol-pal system protein YbgF, partial [Defluviicoccus sp.]
PATPREVYAGAFAQLQREKYPEAETGFQQFLKRYPDDPLAENANYWLGESYYAQGDYARAATTFLEGYEKHKKGAKASDTLLKLAMSLGRLNKKPEACATLQELGRAFPGAPSAIKTKAGDERRRLGCS